MDELDDRDEEVRAEALRQAKENAFNVDNWKKLLKTGFAWELFPGGFEEFKKSKKGKVKRTGRTEMKP